MKSCPRCARPPFKPHQTQMWFRHMLYTQTSMEEQDFFLTRVPKLKRPLNSSPPNFYLEVHVQIQRGVFGLFSVRRFLLRFQISSLKQSWPDAHSPCSKACKWSFCAQQPKLHENRPTTSAAPRFKVILHLGNNRRRNTRWIYFDLIPSSSAEREREFVFVCQTMAELWSWTPKHGDKFEHIHDSKLVPLVRSTWSRTKLQKKSRSDSNFFVSSLQNKPLKLFHFTHGHHLRDSAGCFV